MAVRLRTSAGTTRCGAARSGGDEWLKAALGLWLIAAPWILGFAHASAMHVSIAMGVAITFFALLELWVVHDPDYATPIVAIALGFDSVNSEFNRRTMSRILAQPIYRDALLIGKFPAGLITLAVVLSALWLLVIGLGILLLGLLPNTDEVLRGFAFQIAAIAYGGVWLALAMLFSVIFRSTATSALCALGVWLFFLIVWPLIVPTIVLAFASPDVMSGRASIDETLALIQFQSFLDRLSPNTLFGEAVIGLLNPETRTLGPIIQSQMRGAIMGAPLPLDQSLLLIWPQITGLIAGMIVIFAAAYIIFQREEVRA